MGTNLPALAPSGEVTRVKPLCPGPSVTNLERSAQGVVCRPQLGPGAVLGPGSRTDKMLLQKGTWLVGGWNLCCHLGLAFWPHFIMSHLYTPVSPAWNIIICSLADISLLSAVLKAVLRHQVLASLLSLLFVF